MSKTKRLLVITEGGREFGFGHITRTQSISYFFTLNGFSIRFIINGDDSICNDDNILIFDWINDTKLLFNEIEKSTIILLDSIVVSNDLIKQIEKKDKPVIFIDDDKRRNILDRGFVLDWTVLSEKKDYFKDKKDGVKYFLGSYYTPLRKEFLDIKKHKIDTNLNSITITFGGSDIRNLTPKIMRYLSEKFCDITLNVVIGNGYSNVEEIKSLKKENINLIYNATAIQMIELMQNSSLVIASGGQTLYEMAYIGVPAISILLVDNAKDDTIGWDEVGAIKYIGWYNDKNLLQNLVYEIYNLKDSSKRLSMQKNGMKYIGKGGINKFVKEVLDGIV